MVIYSVYIVSKSGGLIFNYDHNLPKIETEKTYSFPLEHKLVYQNKQVVVAFGQRNGVNGESESSAETCDLTDNLSLLLFLFSVDSWTFTFGSQWFSSKWAYY